MNQNGNAPRPAPPWHHYPIEPRVREALFAIDQVANQARDEVADAGAAIVRIENRLEALDRIEAALTVLARHTVPQWEQQVRELSDKVRREREARLKLSARVDAAASLADQAKDEAVTATGRLRAVSEAELVQLRGWRAWVVDKLWSLLAALLIAFVAGALGWFLRR